MANGESPFLEVLRGGEVPKTAPPTYDFDNRVLRDFKQNEAVMEITNPNIPEILTREKINPYAYSQEVKKKRRKYT